MKTVDELTLEEKWEYANELADSLTLITNAVFKTADKFGISRGDAMERIALAILTFAEDENVERIQTFEISAEVDTVTPTNVKGVEQ